MDATGNRAGAAEAPDAAARRPRVDPGHRLRPDRHRPGLRVRLLGDPGVPGARRGGVPGRPRQLEPRDDHDRPGDGRPHLRRAPRPRRARGDHRAGAARRAAADARRPDRAQPDHGAARTGRARRARGRGDRRERRGDRDRRGPRAVQGGDGGDRARGPRRGLRPLPRRGARDRRAIGFPVMVRPSFILGGAGTGHRRRRATTSSASPRRALRRLARSPRSSSSGPSRAGRSSSSR